MIQKLHHLAPLLALALLAGIGLAALSRPGPADAAPYHARVRQAVEGLPLRVGDWVAIRSELPPEAVDLLNPNALLSLRYQHARTGQSATLLVVHCRDARDMAGHYPPICYPAHGWTQEAARPRTWRVGGIALPGMEYRYAFREPGGAARMVVSNFMVMPDGRVLRDIAGVYAAAADYTNRFYGAGQVQLVTSPALSPDERDAIFRELITASLPAIEAMRSGFADPPDEQSRPPGDI